MNWKQAFTGSFALTGGGYFLLGVSNNDPIAWAVVSVITGLIGGVIFGSALWAFARVFGFGR